MIKLREALVFPGIVDSERVCALPLACQLFFRNLLHCCDGRARFSADAAELRAALYWRTPAVSRPHLEAWLQKCAEARLVNLYTRDGKKYGELVNYRQRDSARKAHYPPPAGQVELELPADDPPPRPKRARELNRIEGNSPHSPPPAGGGVASLSPPTGKPRRFARMPRLDTLNDQLAYINQAMEEILRPGGCAYNVLPTDPAKVATLERLQKQKAQTQAAIERVRAKLAEAPE